MQVFDASSLDLRYPARTHDHPGQHSPGDGSAQLGRSSGGAMSLHRRC